MDFVKLTPYEGQSIESTDLNVNLIPKLPL